jgi:hypothetical protein
MEESRAPVRPVGMQQSPHSYLALAHARQDDLLREADRHRLARSLRNERPGALARLRAHFARRREPQSRPVTAYRTRSAS